MRAKHYHLAVLLSFALMATMGICLLAGPSITGKSISDYIVSEGRTASLGLIISGAIFGILLVLRESALESILEGESPLEDLGGYAKIRVSDGQNFRRQKAIRKAKAKDFKNKNWDKEQSELSAQEELISKEFDEKR